MHAQAVALNASSWPLLSWFERQAGESIRLKTHVAKVAAASADFVDLTGDSDDEGPAPLAARPDFGGHIHTFTQTAALPLNF